MSNLLRNPRGRILTNRPPPEERAGGGISTGCYVTTEWFVFLFVPIIPLRSLRVRYLDEDHGYLGIRTSTRYTVYEKTLPNWKQVLCTYAFFGALNWLGVPGLFYD